MTNLQINEGTNKLSYSQSFNNICTEMKGYIFDEMTCFFDGGGRNILRGGKRGGGKRGARGREAGIKWEGNGGKRGAGKRGLGTPCPPPHLKRATICLL